MMQRCNHTPAKRFKRWVQYVFLNINRACFDAAKLMVLGFVFVSWVNNEWVWDLGNNMLKAWFIIYFLNLFLLTILYVILEIKDEKRCVHAHKRRY